MQTATCTVALAGDTGNTVRKWGVTPSEVAVLMLVHGNEAVTEIKINGDVARTHRAERERLSSAYGRPQPDGSHTSPPVNALFPGAAARLFETFEELEIGEDLFVDPPRSVHNSVVVPKVPPLSTWKKAPLLQLAETRGIEVSADDTKQEIIAAIEAAPPAPAVVDEDDDDSGIEDMPNEGNLFQ